MRLVITLSVSVLLSFGIASAVHGELSGAGTPPAVAKLAGTLVDPSAHVTHVGTSEPGDAREPLSGSVLCLVGALLGLAIVWCIRTRRALTERRALDPHLRSGALAPFPRRLQRSRGSPLVIGSTSAVQDLIF